MCYLVRGHEVELGGPAGHVLIALCLVLRLLSPCTRAFHQAANITSSVPTNYYTACLRPNVVVFGYKICSSFSFPLFFKPKNQCFSVDYLLVHGIAVETIPSLIEELI